MDIEAPLPGRVSAATAGGVATRRRAWTWSRVISASQPYIYLLPAFIPIFIWIYWPVIGTIELSFYQWNLLPTSPRVPVGFENFGRVVTLPEMGQALGNTLIYTVGLLPFSVFVPLAIALMINDITGRMRSIYRVIIFVPVLMAPVVVAILWRWILHPTQGILYTGVLSHLGFEPISWFRNPDLAIWAITFISGWKFLGFSVLIFSAGLTGISRDYMEAAAVDGASKLQIVRHITLPLLSPTIAFMLLLTLLLSAQWTFPLINALTQGGPLDNTTNIYYLLWEFGFRNFNVGFSSAAAILFFIGFGAIAYGFTRLIDRYSFYDA